MLKKLCVAAALALPLSAMAEGLSYNYLEGSYVIPENDDAFRIGGSFLLNPQFFLKADGTVFEGGNLLTGQLGYRHALNNTLDLNITGGLLYADPDGGDSETGYTFGGGLRALVAPQLELNGGIAYVDIYDNSDVAFSVGAVYNFNANWAISGGGTFVDDADEFNVGVRYNF